MILIDSRAGSSALLTYAPLNNPSLACKADLRASDSRSSVDIQFTGNGPAGKISIRIEFKSLSDLLSSIHDGRLNATQSLSMLEESDSDDICILLYYGEYRCGASGFLEIPSINFVSKKSEREYYWFVKGVPYQGPYVSRTEALNAHDNSPSFRQWTTYEFIGNKPLPFGYLESSLVSLLRAGIHPKHFNDIPSCAQWIGVLYRNYNKPYDKHKFFRTFDKSAKFPVVPGMDSVTRQIQQVAKELLPNGGLGFERSLAAANYFSSVQEMINAGVKDWLEVPGIGKTLATSIVEAVSRSKSKATKTQAQKTDLSIFD